ncbi:MAG: DNA cytosine methyltransferase [Pseudomonadales bacterium]
MVRGGPQRAARGRPSRTLVSLFTGAGGFDLGLERAGFHVALCVEMDAAARETLRANRPRWPLAKPGDIHLLRPEAALERARLARGELTLLAGGPPCQPFSKSGYWARGDASRLADPRAATLLAYLRWVEALLPEVILLENVLGLAFRAKDEGLRLLNAGLEQINRRQRVGYKPHVIHINAASYGVPQRRERVILVAHREGLLFERPRATHLPTDDTGKAVGVEPYRTAWDAIGDLDVEAWPAELRPTGKWGELLSSIPEGMNYLWHTPRGGGLPLFGWRTRYWSFLLKLAKDRPSWTIQAEPGPATGPFHWRSRRLSIRELCRLQTFPDNYEICGSYRDAHRQVGNAVPPAVGELLGLEVRRQLLGDQVYRKQRFVPARSLPCPPPEPVKAVPRVYYSLVGAHRDHPGPGQGPRARGESMAA